MAKMKVFELAKKLKMDEEALLHVIREIGLPIESSSDVLEAEEVRILEEKLRREKSEKVVEERIKPTVIRRRAKSQQESDEELEREKEESQAEAIVSPENREIGEVVARRGTGETPLADQNPVLSDEVQKEPSEPRRTLRKGIKTVPKEEATTIVRPTIVSKPVRQEPRISPEPSDEAQQKTAQPPQFSQKPRGEAPRREARPPFGEKPKGKEPVAPLFRAAMSQVGEEKKREPDKKRKRKNKSAPVAEKLPLKRTLKKREVLVRPETVVQWDDGQPVRAKSSKKAKPKTVVKKEFLKPTITTPKASKRVIRIEEVISVGELSKRMGVKAGDLIKKLMSLGMIVNINHVIDLDTATLIANDFGYEIENVAFEERELFKDVEDTDTNLVYRPPVVTIMGHVDHGKTTLLDAIRQTNVAGGEHGGITQHIGAYEVAVNDKKVIFLDTPGHQAFTTMRARGAQVTDIVVLVVAAEDGVMPQTVEAINHAKAAEVPIIVAINKIDKPDANPERIKKDLMTYSLVSEDLGGETIFVEISAKKKLGLDNLLEMILIQVEVLELKANPDKPARGVVIEAKLDRGRGPIATVLIKEGTLKVGDFFVTGLHFGKVRALINDRGQNIIEAGPSIPVEILGLGGVPESGDHMIVVDSEKDAKEVTIHRQLKEREKEMVSIKGKVTLEDFYNKIKHEGAKDLNLIIKADVQGSVEALSDSLNALSTDEVRVNIVHVATGMITESDVMLASASQAVLIGFGVRPEPKVIDLADSENVEIKLYNVIYTCVDDIKKAMTGMLAPKYIERYLGKAEVKDVFSIPKIGSVAGCVVIDGKIVRNSNIRVIRKNEIIFTGKLASLKRFKDDAKEVQSGVECGIKIENFNGVEQGDSIEAFDLEETKPEL